LDEGPCRVGYLGFKIPRVLQQIAELEEELGLRPSYKVCQFVIGRTSSTKAS
jgi:hypothetical protein